MKYNFFKEPEKNFSLQNKQLFKKRAGNAKYYYQLEFGNMLDNDLKCIAELYRDNIPFKIFGMHTNLYITDNGYDGFFIDISPKNYSIKFDEKSKSFFVTSNTTVAEFVKYAIELGYDFSSLAGIPGMVGSGVVGNSSWLPTVKAFCEYVKEIVVYDFEEDVEKHLIPRSDFFTPRDSFIKNENRNKTRYFVKEIVLEADFIGVDKVREKYDMQMERRRKNLKFGFQEGTAGSVWSNIHLIDEIGTFFPKMLKEHPSINADFNGATYSKNCDFFTTSKDTTDSDVAKLFLHTIAEVKRIYGVDLHKEVLILDYDGDIDLETFLRRYGR